MSSVTQSTHQSRNNRTYNDLLIILQEKENIIKQLSKRLTYEVIVSIDFSCSQEQSVVDNIKKNHIPMTAISLE